jgi:hypothetical protein
MQRLVRILAVEFKSDPRRGVSGVDADQTKVSLRAIGEQLPVTLVTAALSDSERIDR